MSKTHVIDGVTYVEVDRNAKECEKIIAKLTDSIFDVILSGRNGKAFIQGGGYISKEYYNVLEPLPEQVTVDTSQASEQVIEMFAALSRKIVSLESQLRDTQRNVERQAEEFENAKHRISKHATMFGAVEERFDLVTEDLIMLDARTQVINAITKFYEEGSR